jgi:CheY-like chemotaxis protein
MVLEMDGHTVAIAHDGRAGLAMAASFDPDLILCDIGLPGDLDGYGVARRLRDAPPRAKRLHLIAMTGFGAKEDQDRALRAGFDTHLTKPVALATLATVIDSLP